jgi:quercetin dioxygenase-like cupin family protein
MPVDPRQSVERRASAVRADAAEPTIPLELVAPQFFGAPPLVRRIQQALGTDQVEINAVFFEAGSRSRPHSHTRDQILYYAQGTGVVALAGSGDQRVEVGEFVLLPGGVPHMHGATDDGPAMHISIMREVDMDFNCPIPPAWQRWRDAAVGS